MSDDDTQGPDSDPARRYVVGHWGSAPEKAYLAAVTGGLAGVIRRLTTKSPLSVRRIPQSGPGFVRCEVLAEDARAVAELVASVSAEEIARFGPWVSEWPPYWGRMLTPGDPGCWAGEVDYGPVNPVWTAMRSSADYIAGYEDALGARAVLARVLRPRLSGGPMAMVPRVRDKGRGALRLDLAPWDAEWLWLVLCYVEVREAARSRQM